ncbi:MAG: hypothetical protein ACYTFG_01950 [Planctomycetota bacterium]|jgi:hypothetical protein
MKTRHRTLLALLTLASALVGCGTTAEFVAPETPRSPLKKGFYTTYTFKYEVKAKGALGGLFSGKSLTRPRLLYTEGEADYEEAPESFRDTGAPFDTGKSEITWRIPNIRDLWGKTFTFVLDAKNIVDPPAQKLTFPPPGKVLSVEPTPEGRKVRFTLTHSETVYNVRFFARISRSRRDEIHPQEEESPSEGIRLFVWDPVKDIDPGDSDIPLSFAVQYENWYYETNPIPYITSAVRIPRAVVFSPYAYLPQDKVRIPFRMWGKVGLMSFDFRYGDAGEWRVVKGLKVVETEKGDRVAMWDLHVEGLAPLTKPVELRARALGRDLGICRVLPPKPAIRVLSHRQEGDTVYVLFDASYIASEDVRLFAGFGKRQRLITPEEVVKRTEGMIAFKVDRLPVAKGPRGNKDLRVFLTAENAAGEAGTELEIPLVNMTIQSLRQAQDEVEIRLEPRTGTGPVKLEYRLPGSKEWKASGPVAEEEGKLRWAIVQEFGGDLPPRLDIRLRATRDHSYGEALATLAPLHVSVGKSESRGGGVFEIPVKVMGSPDWVRFEYDLGEGFRTARSAAWDRERHRIRWDLWGDVSREVYGGEKATLRATFRNPWGFFTVLIEGVQPEFLKLGVADASGGIVRIPVHVRPGTQVTAYASTDWGRTFKPVKGARFDGRELSFDLGSLGPLTGASLMVRVATTGRGGAREEADVTLRLPAGIEPSRAYWHQGQLWIRYEVDWHVSEKDVRVEFSLEGPEARPPLWLKASVTSWKTLDVNRRAFAWDVGRDMARVGEVDSTRFNLRLVIQQKTAGAIVREIGLGELPDAPISLPGATMGLTKGNLTFSLGEMNLPGGAPPFSSRLYHVRMSYLDPDSGDFKPARVNRRLGSETTLAWSRDQALSVVKGGTWVKLTVTLKGDNRVTGWILFDVRLAQDHPFFDTENDEGF